MAQGGLNKALLIGVVISNPEMRTTRAGAQQAMFRMTTTETWFDKETNEKREKTLSHKIVVYSPPLIKIVSRCVRKGARVLVEGNIETRRWTAKDGTVTDSWVTDIVVQGWSGRLTILDFAPDHVAADAPPKPLSIATSRAKYGDDTDAAPDQESDKINPALSWLAP